MNAALAIGAGLGFSLVLFALSYLLSYCAIYGWRFTTRMPGGLESVLRKPDTLKSESNSDILAICNPQNAEHYQMVCFGSPFGAIVWLVGTPQKYVTVVRFTKAYRSLRSCLRDAPTIEDSVRDSFRQLDDWKDGFTL